MGSKWAHNNEIFWISSRVGHSSGPRGFLVHMSFALDVFFSYWTGWWFSQIFSTLDHFHVLLNSQPRDLWRTPPNISGCSLSFGAQSKLPTPQFWIVTPWCSPGIIAVPGASASFGGGPSFCEEPQIRLCLWWVVAGQEMEIHPRERKRWLSPNGWMKHSLTITFIYWTVGMVNDGDKCWKAFNETSKTLKVESRSVCQDMSTWCPMILGPEGHSLKYIRVRSSTVIVLWFHDIDEYTMNFKALPELEWSLTCLLLNYKYIYLIYLGIWE